MSEEFGGDVLLIDTVDGSELSIVNGLVIADGGFRTAVLLSLFGGNDKDTGAVITEDTWWGNYIEGKSENEKMVSRFITFINSSPLISKNVALAESKAQEDLKWLIDDGAADAVDCSISVVEANRIELKVTVSKGGKIIEDGKYGLQWEAMKNGV